MIKIFEEKKLNAKSFKWYPIIALQNFQYSLLIALKWYWEAAIEAVLQNYLNIAFFKIANLQNIQLYLCSKSTKKDFNFVKLQTWSLHFNEKLNSFVGIFWLVLVQLPNWFFVEHLSVAAYVLYLKEKEWK